MGDVRFERPYERLRAAPDPLRELYALSDDDVIQALAAASNKRDPLLANILATEAMNRMRRAGTAVAHLGEGVIACDASGRITGLNPAAERLLGYSREELIGRDIHDTIHHHDAQGRPLPRQSCSVLGVLATGEPAERDDDAYTRKDGTILAVAYTAAPILRDGEVEGVVSAFRDTTEARRARAQIEFQKSLLEAQADSSPDGQLVVDAARRVLSYNAAFRRMWGFARDELDKLDDRELVQRAARQATDPETFLARAEMVYERLQAGARDDIHLTDGRVLDRICTLVRAPDGATLGWLWTFRDVTSERAGLQQLRLSEERYRTLYQALPFMTFTVGDDLRIRNANDVAQESLGYARGELEDATALDLYAPEDRAEVARHLTEVLARGGVHRLEVRKLRRDGSPVDVRETATRTRSPTGETVLLIMCEDITARKRQEADLAESRERLLSLYEGSPDGIVTVGIDGTIVNANAASIPFTGRTPDEVRGHMFTEYVHPDDLDRVWGLFERVVGGQAVRTEFVILHKEGSAAPARVTGIPIVVDGEVVGVHGVLQDLTAERRAQGLATELTAAAFDAIVTIDADDRVLEWNPAASRLFGYSREEAIGQELARLVVPERHRDAHLRGVRAAALHAHAERRPRRYELSALRKDGTEFPAEISITSLPGDEARFAGFVRDLTERHRHDGALTRFQRLVDAVEDYAIYMLDPDGSVTSWNTGAERIKGYSDEEVLGRHYRMFYPPEAQAKGRPEHNLAEALASGHFEEEGWRVRKDGSRFWAGVTITPIRDAEGGLTGYAKVARDLTPAREADAARERRARQHAVVAELGLDALRDAPLADVFERAVRDLQEVLAVDYTKVLQLDPGGATLTLRAGVGWQPHIRAHHSKVSAGLESQAGYTLVTDGPVVVEDLRMEPRFHGPPLLVDHDVVSGMSVVIHGAHAPWGVLGIHSRTPRRFTRDDVAFLQSVANVLASAIQRRDAEAGLERRVEERTRRLSEANRDLQTFANAASHDLRAPIRGVDTLLTALHEDHGPRLPEDARDLLAKALRENRRAGRLVQDILGFARSAQHDLRPADVDLTALARDVARELDAQHPERRTRWTIQDGMRVRADPGLLRIAMWNLLENAAKYSAHNPHPQVDVSATHGADGGAIVRVGDNGVGFDPAEAHRLFEPFSRLGTARGIEGTGLGLATAARIVDRHGGRISAEGRPGRGATFRVHIPQRSP